MTWPMIGGRRLTLGAVLATALLAAGCGNDTSGTEGSRIALGVAAELKNRLMPGRAAAAGTPDTEKLAASAKKSVKGPIILAQIEKTGLLTVLGQIGRNGDLQTFATPNEQTLQLRRGVLVGSRGLGDDLMSAEADGTTSLILARQAGSANRVYRYLDGEGIERPLPMRCTITPGPAKSFDFSGAHYDTVQMDETCEGGGIRIANKYWVTSGATVALSHQWIGPAIGYVTIQLVRS